MKRGWVASLENQLEHCQSEKSKLLTKKMTSANSHSYDT